MKSTTLPVADKPLVGIVPVLPKLRLEVEAVRFNGASAVAVCRAVQSAASSCPAAWSRLGDPIRIPVEQLEELICELRAAARRAE